MAKSAQVMIDKYKKGITGGAAAYIEGVQSTTKDPIALAIASKDKYQAKLIESFAEGSFEKGLAGWNKQAWQQVAVAAAPKFTAAAPQAATKYARFAAIAAPMQAQFSAQIDSMPSATDADMDARMLANAALQRTMKGVMRGKR